MSLGAVNLGSQEVLQHAQKAVESTPQQLQDFSEVLSQLDSQGGADQNAAINVQNDLPTLDISQVELPGEVDGAYSDKLEQVSEPGGPERLLAEAQDKYSRLDQLIGEVGSGRSFSPEELVGLQTEMHKITFELEATTKVMGQMVSGVKTLMQQQI